MVNDHQIIGHISITHLLTKRSKYGFNLSPYQEIALLFIVPQALDPSPYVGGGELIFKVTGPL